MTDLHRASVATVGFVTHDLYDDGAKPGGGAFYSGRTYLALGHPTQLITSFGDDFRFANELRGFDRRAKIGGRTTTFVNDYRQGAARQQLIQAVAPKVPPTRTTADLVHLTPVFDEVELAEWRPVVERSIVALSIQGLTRRLGSRIEGSVEAWQRGTNPAISLDAHTVESTDWSPRPGELSWIDIVCLSEEDVAGNRGLASRLRREVRHGCYTMGQKGSWIWDRDQSWWVGIHRTRAVDTTGAGDVFAATFAASLVSGMAADLAARRAAAAASVVVESEGASGLRRLPSELDRRVEGVPVRAEGTPF